MAKKTKKEKPCLVMRVYRHGAFWWLTVGWWWRPVYYLLWILVAVLTGFGLKRMVIDE